MLMASWLIPNSRNLPPSMWGRSETRVPRVHRAVHAIRRVTHRSFSLANLETFRRCPCRWLLLSFLSSRSRTVCTTLHIYWQTVATPSQPTLDLTHPLHLASFVHQLRSLALTFATKMHDASRMCADCSHAAYTPPIIVAGSARPSADGHEHASCHGRAGNVAYSVAAHDECRTSGAGDCFPCLRHAVYVATLAFHTCCAICKTSLHLRHIPATYAHVCLEGGGRCSNVKCADDVLILTL